MGLLHRHWHVQIIMINNIKQNCLCTQVSIYNAGFSTGNIEIYSMSNFHCGPMSILHWLILVYFHRCCRLLKAMFCVGCWLSQGRFLSSDEQIAIGILQLEDIILHSDTILYGKTISPESRSQLQSTPWQKRTGSNSCTCIVDVYIDHSEY